MVPSSALLPWFLTAASVLGLLIGSFLNVVVWRVPRGESLLPDSHCPNCGAAIRPWQNVPVISWLVLKGRCASCRNSISARYPLVELGTCAVFALVAWWYASSGPLGSFTDAVTQPAGSALGSVAWWLGLIAYLWFAAVSVALTLIDLEHRRLPDAIVLPSLLVVAILLSAASLFAGDWARLVSTLGGGAALFAAYLLIALVYPAGIGGGDVKLAPLLGLVLGFVGWAPLVLGAFAGFGLGALLGLVLIVARRATRKTGLPFGPFMLLGAWIGAVWGQWIVDAYLGLFGLG